MNNKIFFLLTGFLSCSNMVHPMDHSKQICFNSTKDCCSVYKFRTSPTDRYFILLGMTLKAEQEALEKKRKNERIECIKHLCIDPGFQQKIEQLPLEMVNHIVEQFTYDKQAWGTTNIHSFKYAWGTHADLKQEKVKNYLSKFTSHDYRANTAQWNENKTKLLVTFQNKTTCLWDINSGKKLAELLHDTIPTIAFFMHDSASLFLAQQPGIISYEHKSKQHHAWGPYTFTLDQALIYKLLYTWLLVKKANKYLFFNDRWYADSLSSFIENIQNTIMFDMPNKNNLLTVWMTIPKSVRKNIWWDIRKFVLKHGHWA